MTASMVVWQLVTATTADMGLPAGVPMLVVQGEYPLLPLRSLRSIDGCVVAVVDDQGRVAAYLHGSDCDLTRSVAVPLDLGVEVVSVAPCARMQAGRVPEFVELPS